MGFYADITCGPVCWEAREDTCRCSCAGARHGVLRSINGERPRRECKIDGKRYVLVAAGRGSNPFNEWFRAERDAIVERFGVTYGGSAYRFMPSNLTVEKLASEKQSDSWPECPRSEGRRVYLYWIREDAAPMFEAWQASRVVNPASV